MSPATARDVAEAPTAQATGTWLPEVGDQEVARLDAMAGEPARAGDLPQTVAWVTRLAAGLHREVDCLPLRVLTKPGLSGPGPDRTKPR